MASDSQKTKTCPYCGTRVDTVKSRWLATAEDAFTAAEMLRELKTKKATG